MSLLKKLLIAAGFICVLLLLGTSDVLLTKGTLHLPKQDDGIAKKAGPDVVKIAEAQGFTVTETTEQNLLPIVLSPGAKATFTARVLLQDDDRVATIGWIDSQDVKEIFTDVRKLLRSSFSMRLTDLTDETQTAQGMAPRDVLSFRDPAILEDRALFVRVRERLYELHVKEGREGEMNALIDALTE